jgi:hypothetical protein
MGRNQAKSNMDGQVMEEGPQLEALTRRLAECPADFLAEPRRGAAGVVQVAAVVADLLADWGGPALTPTQAAVFRVADAPRQANWLRLVLVACWLWRDPWFVQRRPSTLAAFKFLAEDLGGLAQWVQAPQCVLDPDRREELTRACLKALGLYPKGETPVQALDRLNTLDSVERQRVIQAAREAEARSRAIRDAMAAKAAQEAADKWTRE